MGIKFNPLGPPFDKVDGGSVDLTDYRKKIDTVIWVDPDGKGDYTTIQGALDDNATENITVMVAPGTYTDTIHFTANNQSVKAVGNCPTQTTVQQANANVVNFGTFTNCRVIEFKLLLTAPSSYVNLVSGDAAGGFSGKLYRCYGNVSGNTFTTFAPQIFGHPTNPYTGFTSAATLELIRGTYVVTDTTTATLKSVIWVPTNLTLITEDAKLYGNFTNGGYFCPGIYGSGTVSMAKTQIIMTGDDLLGDVYGVLVIGTTDAVLNQNYIDVTASGTTVNAYGLGTSGSSTITITSNYNTYKAAGGTTASRGLANLGSSITINSSMDAIIGDDNIFNNGTINMVSVNGTGNWQADGDLILGGDVTDGTNATNAAEIKNAYDHVSATGNSHSGVLLKDGTRELTGDWDAGNYAIQAKQFSADNTSYYGSNVFGSYDFATNTLLYELSSSVARITRTGSNNRYVLSGGTEADTSITQYVEFSTVGTPYIRFHDGVTTTESSDIVANSSHRVSDGSDHSLVVTKTLAFIAVASDTAVTTGDGVYAIPINATLNGWEITDVTAFVHDKGVTGTTDIQIRKRRAGSDVDVLSTKVTIGDEWYASDGVVNSANKTLATGDLLYVDVDAIHSGTAPNGLSVTIKVQLF